MNDGFHARDGWFFKRLEYGAVEISNDEGSIVLTENEWASVVCSVSGDGENGERWMQARKFHGTPLSHPSAMAEAKGEVMLEELAGAILALRPHGPGWRTDLAHHLLHRFHITRREEK